MNKKIVKIVSTVTGVLLIGCIIHKLIGRLMKYVYADIDKSLTNVNFDGV